MELDSKHESVENEVKTGPISYPTIRLGCCTGVYSINTGAEHSVQIRQKLSHDWMRDERSELIMNAG